MCHISKTDHFIWKVLAHSEIKYRKVVYSEQKCTIYIIWKNIFPHKVSIYNWRCCLCKCVWSNSCLWMSGFWSRPEHLWMVVTDVPFHLTQILPQNSFNFFWPSCFIIFYFIWILFSHSCPSALLHIHKGITSARFSNIWRKFVRCFNRKIKPLANVWHTFSPSQQKTIFIY